MLNKKVASSTAIYGVGTMLRGGGKLLYPVAAYVLQCWTEYVRFGILNAAKTIYLAYAAYIRVFLFTGLYFVWIPVEGAVGAAKTTLVAFFVRFGIIYYFSQKLFKIDHPWLRLVSLIAYFCLTIIPDELWVLPLKACIVLFAMTLLMFTPIIEKQHRLYVWQAVRKVTGDMIKKVSG